MNKYFSEKKILFADGVSVSSGKTADLFHLVFLSSEYIPSLNSSVCTLKFTLSLRGTLIFQAIRSDLSNPGEQGT